MSEDSLVFYTNPQSRGRIGRWMLEEVAVPYRTEVVQFGDAMKSAQYLSINPMGKVPAIVHNGKVVTEVAAICAYLADACPEARLAPPLSERGNYYRWLFFVAGPLEAAVTNKALKVEVPAEREGMVGYGNFDRVVETLVKAVSGRRFIASDRFTAADLYVGSHINWGMQFGTLPRHPEFVRYWEELGSRAACKRANELDDRLVAKQ
ncbi:MAG TPA: glutathione S-transferase family protein [Woeseiaceae bacterium]